MVEVVKNLDVDGGGVKNFLGVKRIIYKFAQQKNGLFLFFDFPCFAFCGVAVTRG